MRPARTWHGVSLLIALGLATASAAAFAANLKPDEPAHPFSYLNVDNEAQLGLIVKDTNEAKAKELKLPHVTGAIVVSVIPGSPAAKAGFQPNDVILQFDGRHVRSVVQLRRLIEETPAGRTVKVEIVRQEKLQTLQAKIENRGPNAFLEKPVNPKYRIWHWPAYKLPLQPQQPEPFVEPVPKGKIIPLPPVIPKFYLGPLPNLKPQPLPMPEPFIEPGPKGEVSPSSSRPPAEKTPWGFPARN